MPNPLISVMMPAYNTERYIGLAIESLLAQTYPYWELIVVNDGSTDQTAEIVSHYLDSRIQLIHRENGGEAAARNTALCHLHGEFVAFLDADDLFLPQHLEVTVAYFQDHPDHQGVYTDGYYIDQNGNRLEKLSSHRRGPFEGSVFDQVVRASDVFGPPLCMILSRKTIVDHNLAYDTTVGLGTDWDFYTRFTEVAKFGYVDQTTCLYRIHQANITLTTKVKDRKRGRAICRLKAIRLLGFSSCSLETQVYSFYDLLVNLLADSPEPPTTILNWPEFHNLPTNEQARLLRLLAIQAIICGVHLDDVNEWLRRARAVNPSDLRNRLLFTLYSVSPTLCQVLLRLWIITQRKTPTYTPFGAID